jgi:hypothetical protein
MSKKLIFLIAFAAALGLTYTCFGAPGTIKLDFDAEEDVNACGDSLEPGYTCFLYPADNGSTINGITIDIRGDTPSYADYVRTKRNNITQDWIDWGVGTQLYPDMVYARYPSGLNITLWELGAGQTCTLTLWAYDNQSEERRVADWYANGVWVFRSDFTGGEDWPNCTENPCEWGPPTYAYDFNATADALGRIALTSVIGPNSLAQMPFAFANGLRVIPGTYTSATTYAHRPLPYNDEINVSVKTVLKWRNGATAATRDVYLGTSSDDVDTATRAQPKGVLIATDQGPNSIDPYGATGFLKMDTTYYWRVDEVIGGTPQKGEVWSFKTAAYCEIENWDSYADTDALREVWKDYYTQDPYTSAEVYVEYGIDGNSMRYWYRNDLTPYYSEANATMANLGVDPNWQGMGAAALSVWFYGDETNLTTEPMYIILTDGNSQTAAVTYPDTNNLKAEYWQEWIIDLQDFVSNNPSFNLRNVAQIIIRFGDPPLGNNGTVYFDDLRLYPTRCVLSERDAIGYPNFARVDYAPGGAPPGDCVINDLELEIMADLWLTEDVCIPTKDPGIFGLVGYWSMNEGDGNRIYPTDFNSTLGIPEADLIGWMDPCDDRGISSGAISWSTGVPMQDINGVWFEGSALKFNGQDGIRVEFGPQFSLDPNAANLDPAAPNGHLSLSIWMKWAGRHLDKDKSQGLISKRREWADNENGVQFIFEIDTYPGPLMYSVLKIY